MPKNHHTEDYSELNIRSFVLRHALWFKENLGMEESINFVRATLKDRPVLREELIKMIRED